MSDSACYRQFETTFHSAVIWKLGLAKAVDQRPSSNPAVVRIQRQGSGGHNFGTKICVVSPSGDLTAQSQNHMTRILNYPGVIEQWGYIKNGREVENRWRPTWGYRHSPL